MRVTVSLVSLVLLGACGGSDSTMGADGGSGGSDGGGTDGTRAGPRCAARDCGPDGQGGSCGSCGSTFACDDNLGLCIPDNGGDATVTFQGACWFVCPATPPQGFSCTPSQKFQAIQFDLQTSFPIEGTLYFDNDCDPLGGTDNLNDTGAATPTFVGLEWFIHHPDERPSSAVWWFGHHSTGCLDYATAPDCP